LSVGQNQNVLYTCILNSFFLAHLTFPDGKSLSVCRKLFTSIYHKLLLDAQPKKLPQWFL
jgi:hypothetical protein